MPIYRDSATLVTSIPIRTMIGIQDGEVFDDGFSRRSFRISVARQDTA